MSRTFSIRFDTGNAAFEDYGRDQEVAAVIRRAADKIERHGLEDGFKVSDTNGNSIGEFSEVSLAPVPPAANGEVLLTIETGNAAFDDDPAAEVLRILRHAAKRIEQGDWPGGLLDYNGNRVGTVEDNPAAPSDESRLPDGAPRYIKLEDIRAQHPTMQFTSNSSETDSLAASTGLAFYSQEWSGIAVVAGDGELLHAWITESSRSFDVAAEFVQVLKDGKTMSWAKEYEESLDAGPHYSVPR